MFELIERRKKIIVFSIVLGVLLVFIPPLLTDNTSFGILGMGLILLSTIRYIEVRIQEEKVTPEDVLELTDERLQTAKTKADALAGRITMAFLFLVVIYTFLITKIQVTSILVFAIVLYRQLSQTIYHFIIKENKKAVLNSVGGIILLILISLRQVPIQYYISLLAIYMIVTYIIKKIDKSKEASW